MWVACDSVFEARVLTLVSIQLVFAKRNTFNFYIEVHVKVHIYSLMMKRHEYWRMKYRGDRYLETASISEIEKRSQEINFNSLTVNDNGQISIHTDAGGVEWMKLGTHIQEEIILRGLDFRTLKIMDNLPRVSHPEPPRGLRILKGQALPDQPYLVRIGQRQHIIDAYSRGRIRIAPAVSYSDPSLNIAIRDDELKVKTILSRKGVLIQKIDEFSGKIIGAPFEPLGDLTITRDINDNFFVLCLTQQYQPRQLDDFDGDGLLIITNPRRFQKRLERAVNAVRPDLKMTASEVVYYDPYKPDPAHIPGHLVKDFRYWYQQEFRMVWTKPGLGLDEKPFFVELGTLKGIASMYVFPK
ncbi:MAG: hypothetical protein COB54_02950 [Alphaproteobacteria bacterium]|nr:MAG: hypothetical protein COB54_02950 [Alphaproteobacteria bacterium]